MNLYRLNAYDWVAAKTLEEAVGFYQERTGVSGKEALDESYAPHVGTRDDMEALTLMDEDGANAGTFAEEWDRQMRKRDDESPFLFASMEI